MFNHAPENYKCPICLGVQGVESEDTLIKKEDFVYRDNLVAAFINSFWIKNNPGHVVVVPNKHVENIYDISPEISHRIVDVAQKIALVMKEVYKCEGITTIQNNEPSGDQHAFHFHFHIFPRYANDQLHKYMGEKQLADPEERKEYAKRLKISLDVG